MEQALLWLWMEGCRPVEPARDRPAVVQMLARIRRAGFADKDFGVHNLLLDARGQLVWTDLERAYRAAADDADATARTAGAALASWWLASAGDGGSLAGFWHELRITAPMPAGGWNTLLEAINRAMMKKCDELIRRGRMERRPPPVVLT